jgi:hypothetical protein
LGMVVSSQIVASEMRVMRKPLFVDSSSSNADGSLTEGLSPILTPWAVELKLKVMENITPKIIRNGLVFITYRFSPNIRNQSEKSNISDRFKC